MVKDRPTLAIVFAVPALQILLFGYAVRFQPRDVPIAIAREQAQPQGFLIHAITETGLFRVVADGLSPGGAAGLVAGHRAAIGIEFPSDPEAGSGLIRVVIDGTDPETVRPAMLALEATLLRETQTPRLPLRVDWLYNARGRSTWAIAPALSGVIVMITMLLLGALTLARERERGTWEALLATPVSGLDALIGKLSPYLVLGTAQAAVVVLVAHALFALPMRGSFGTFLWAAALLALAHLVLGFALSARAETQVQAIQGAVVFYLPSMLLSGFIFPFTGMPRWAQLIGEALPLTHFVRAARDLLLRADDSWLVAQEMWPVAVFAGAAAVLAIHAYRRRLS